MMRSIALWFAASTPARAGEIFLLIFSTALLRAFAQIARLVAISEFDGFVLAGGCAGGNGGAAQHAVRKMHVGFNSGIAARIQNLPANDFDNFHALSG